MNLQEIYTNITSKRSVFVQISQKSYGVDESTAMNIVDGELENYMVRLQKYWDNPKNHERGAPTLSAAQGSNIFLEVLQSALSFSEIASHVYISRLKGTGTAIGYQITVDGLVYLAQKSGSIDHLSEPVLVQVGESFRILNTSEGKQVAEHQIVFDGRPRYSIENFLVGYIYIVYPNGDRELSWIGAERMKQLMSKSSKQAMYNDESFVQTKVIKHALRKVRKSAFMMQRQQQDEEVIQNNMEWVPQGIEAEPVPTPDPVERPQPMKLPQSAPKQAVPPQQFPSPPQQTTSKEPF